MKVIVVVLISSKYLDIAKIFDELFSKFWSNCPYPVFFCCDTDLQNPFKSGSLVVLNNNISLPGRIRTIVNRENADYAICLLGDALIANYVSNENVHALLDIIANENVDYCNLILRNKNKDAFIYQIPNREVYPFSFVCYIASKRFVQNEYDDLVTDIALENKFLDVSANIEKYRFSRIARNVFNIEHAIIKGKWIRRVKRKAGKLSNLAKENTRPTLNMIESLYVSIVDFVIKHSSRKFFSKIRLKGK